MKKIRKVDYYEATGTGNFPDDMLRYDDGAFIAPRDYPLYTEGMTDEVRLPRRHREPRKVIVAYVRYSGKSGANRGLPTYGRWHSFLWGLRPISEPDQPLNDDWITASYRDHKMVQMTLRDWMLE